MKNELPSEVPDVIPPSSDKINLEKLRVDIPKFFSSRVFTDTTRKWWEDFYEDKDGLFAAKEKPPVWLLDDILTIKRRQVSEVVTQTDQAFCEEEERIAGLGLPKRPPNAPKDIEDMVVGQLSEIPQVSKRI